MMEAIAVNWMAIIAAAVASFIIGFAWYSPALFGRQWMKLMGMKTMGKKGGMMKGMALEFAGALVLSYVLFHFLRYAGAVTWMDGAVGGFWVWLGFFATAGLGMVAWERKPWSLYFINMGAMLVSLLVMGAIVAGWGY